MNIKTKSQTTIQTSLFDYFLDSDSFTIKEAEEAVLNVMEQKVKLPSIRARIYEGISKGLFERIGKGVYKAVSKTGKECLLINGDGRDLSFLADNSIDGIITDHPYDLKQSLKGGNRDFATYELFQYNESDFKEKYRVLKEGAFFVEFLPEETETNYEYLYKLKKTAVSCGFKYFAKVPWLKGDFKANTGRKIKNREDMLFLSKGEPRRLKLDTKKNLAALREIGVDAKGKSAEEIKVLLEQNGKPVYYMKGTNGMLPADFNYEPKNKKEKVMEAEKPVKLIESIIEYISLPNELLLDQFGGSGNFAVACMNKGRDSIVMEKDGVIFAKMKNNIESQLGIHFEVQSKRELSEPVIEDDFEDKDFL